MESIYKDERFSHVVKDPRFRSLPKETRKVKIDKRFKPMFEDKRFKLKYSVDKRGKPIDTSTSENLRKYYELSDSSEDEDNDSKTEEDDGNRDVDDEIDFKDRNILSKKKQRGVEKETDKRDLSNLPLSEEESCDDNRPDLCDVRVDSKSESEESGLGSGTDLARGEGNVSSSSDEDEDDEEQNDDFAHNWNELDKDAPVAEGISRRLAMCNMDWDRIKAHDLYALMHSFKPATGLVTSVTIYPSEYGLQRMKEENVAGPQELRVQSDSLEKTKRGTQDTEGSEYHRERLRQYQLNRMKYYYAVVVCDNEDTANHIYTECDGMEYESSSTKLDLRFIPDGMTFDQKPHEICTDMPDSSLYKPSQFYTTALGQSKVELTWDETNRERVVVLTSKFSKDDIKEDNFKAYLASSSDEENPHTGLIYDEEGEDDSEEDEETRLEKYKKLVQGLEENSRKPRNDDTELKVTWEPGLRDTTKDIVKNKQKTKNMTLWSEYLHKKSEKKKKKREDKKLLSDSTKKQEPSEATAAFSDDEIPADIDVTDKYFADEMKTIQKPGKKKKRKGKKTEELTTEELENKEKEKAELSMMLMEEDGTHHYNLKDLIEEGKKKKKKKMKRKPKMEEKIPSEGDFKMDVSDQRFSEIYKSNLFNIDPSAPEFKRTKGIESVIEEKMRRMKEGGLGGMTADKVTTKTSGLEKSVTREEINENETDPFGKKRKKSFIDRNDVKSPRLEQTGKCTTLDTSLASLVKSVKAKTQQFKSSHKKK